MDNVNAGKVYCTKNVSILGKIIEPKKNHVTKLSKENRRTNIVQDLTVKSARMKK